MLYFCVLLAVAFVPPVRSEPIRLASVTLDRMMSSVAATGLPPQGVAVPGMSWGWPVGGPPEVVREFEPPPEPWLAGHRGVDLAAGEGAVILAAGPGVVRFAGIVVDRPLVSITHSDGLITAYEPVAPLVAQGDSVVSGQPIGLLLAEHAGCPATCLHWSLRRDRTYLDPLALLGSSRVRLLPSAGRAGGRRADRIRSRCCRSAR